MFFRYLITFLLSASTCFAGFPPTTTKAAGDTSNQVTFNFLFPNFSVTRSGVSTTFGVNGIAGGGTNNGSLSVAAGAAYYADGSKLVALAPGSAGTVYTSGGAGAPTWTAVLANPMDAIGQLIYGAASGVATKLPAGTLGQILVSGGAAIPVWTGPWYIDATMDGASPSLGVASVASYTEIIDGGLTLKPQSGTANVGVMCSTTNAATAPSSGNTTCAAGSESLGINFALPADHSASSGSYEACVYFGHYINVDSGEALATTFELIETPTNAQTLTLEGGTRQPSKLTGMSIATGTGQDATHPISNCSIFNWTAKSAATVVGIRLMFEQNVSGSPNFSNILADASASDGQRNIRWTVKRIR